ncbi:CD276 antigen -like protein Precursor [Channa argus]|uniref:CD276 antigen-like protein n=1 Tax=Channa argus TaxID=215402 RepID=A0A6G1PDL7_CHAAH|nr:CD276 antigen -like protein Precursor [Channa argus]
MSDLMRFSVIYILVVFTLTAVSCQHQVISSFTGGNVLLPCVYERRDSSSNKVNVFWRDKYDDHVLDIIQNEADRQFQHQNFIDRVEGFPDQYKKGNFSIILKDLRQSDSGVYECFVEDVKQSVQLTVSGERAAAATSPAPGSSAHITAVTLNSLHLLLLSVLLCSVIQTLVTL